MLFVGAVDRQLDEKGRVALPAQFRAHLGEQCYLVKGLNKCVNIMSTADFERVALELRDRVDRGEADLNHQRALAWSATLANIDKQGRVLLADKLREYAGIGDDQQVVVAGNLDRLEIWAPSRFNRVDAAGTTGMAGDIDDEFDDPREPVPS